MKNDKKTIDMDLDRSIKLIGLTTNLVFIFMIILPVLIYFYTTKGVDSYNRIDNFYKVTTTLGQEKIEPFTPSKTPIINLETTKKWVQDSVIELLTYDANSYNSEKRKNKLKEILSTEVFKSYWDKNLERIEEDVKNGYLRSSGITAFKPILLGETTNTNGKKMWKFYLEAQVKLESTFSSYPTYLRKRFQLVVKEVDSKENYNGIGIVHIITQ